MYETTAAAPPRFEQSFHRDAASVREELGRGLSAAQACIEPKYLYDELGSHLFTAITHLPEYYPTRTEARIMQSHLDSMLHRLSATRTLIDLGAADCRKAEILLTRLQPRRYLPVDISVDFLRRAVDRLHASYPALDIVALGQDFSQSLQLPQDIHENGRLFFYPGSSVGNWAPSHVQAMLRRIRRLCDGAGSGLLIGVDCIKPVDILIPAYDDALHVTAAFNRNLLQHLNRLLRTNFVVDDWRHMVRYDTAQSRIEMHLQARNPLTVSWPGRERRFTDGETIHTESSYKYHPQDFADMLEAAGFCDIAYWTDERGWFAVFHARP